MAWVPQRRSQIHRTHREVIGERAARDHAALMPLPPPRISLHPTPEWAQEWIDSLLASAGRGIDPASATQTLAEYGDARRARRPATTSAPNACGNCHPCSIAPAGREGPNGRLAAAVRVAAVDP
ncbi:hypothetical protein [Streptomyces sp. HPF1205]|uniref:hypothetical protein n=1 Tax=Streptomyces sp. HPF1205 TaxID=2873262 RepID=UPI001CED1383|nr:hypothetical protein [Streptomyces sp. HPF1205]